MFSKTKKRIQSTFLKVFSSFLISYILFTSPIYYKKTLKPASDMHLNSSLRLDDVKPIERLNLNTKPLERKIYMDFLKKNRFLLCKLQLIKKEKLWDVNLIK